MAAAVLTPTITRTTVVGDRKFVTAKLVSDTGDYADGGLPVTASDFNLTVLDTVIPLGPGFTATLGWPTAWDSDNSKLVLFESAADGDPMDEKGAEALAATTWYVLAIGY